MNIRSPMALPRHVIYVCVPSDLELELEIEIKIERYREIEIKLEI